MSFTSSIVPLLSTNPCIIKKQFGSFLFKTDDSPILMSCDVGGDDDRTVYINWHDAEGDEFSVEVPFENLSSAHIENDQLIVTDRSGEEQRITFFEFEPVRKNEPQKLTVSGADGQANWVVRLPDSHRLDEGFYYDSELDGLPVNLQAVLTLLGVHYEPEKGETLQVQDYLPSVTDFTEQEVLQAIRVVEDV